MAFAENQPYEVFGNDYLIFFVCLCRVVSCVCDGRAPFSASFYSIRMLQLTLDGSVRGRWEARLRSDRTLTMDGGLVWIDKRTFSTHPLFKVSRSIPLITASHELWKVLMMCIRVFVINWWMPNVYNVLPFHAVFRIDSIIFNGIVLSSQLNLQIWNIQNIAATWCPRNSMESFVRNISEQLFYKHNQIPLFKLQNNWEAIFPNDKFDKKTDDSNIVQVQIAILMDIRRIVNGSLECYFHHRDVSIVRASNRILQKPTLPLPWWCIAWNRVSLDDAIHIHTEYIQMLLRTKCEMYRTCPTNTDTVYLVEIVHAWYLLLFEVSQQYQLI